MAPSVCAGGHLKRSAKDRIGQLQDLADLKTQGSRTDEKLAADRLAFSAG